jgi:aminomethyltransferase
MNTTTSRESPLHGEHAHLGAHFTDFAGWQMPLKYGSDLAEHHTVRRTLGLFDLSHMGEIEVKGPAAAAMLDHALVGVISKVVVGRAKYTLLCTDDGGIIDDLVVYRLADDRFLIVANASNSATVFEALTRRSSHFDVELSDVSTSTALIAVQGPQAQSVVHALAPAESAPLIAALKYYAVTPALVAGVEVLLARTGYTGEDGFELYAPDRDAVTLWRALLQQARIHGGGPAGLACRDSLRLEAGMALYGHELALATNPYEAGLGKIVRLEKDFVGRDALAAISRQPLRRRLVGLTGRGRRAVRAGYPIHGSPAGAVVGTVTSGALSPTLGYPIAIAYVDAALAEPGTCLVVDLRGRTERFTVTSLPFYRRP